MTTDQINLEEHLFKKSNLPLVHAFLMSILMVTIMTFIITAINTGFDREFHIRWLVSWILAWPVAFSIIVFFGKKVMALSIRLCNKD